MHRRNMMPDWLGFWDQAKVVGWKPSNTLSKLEAAVVDTYGPEWRDEWKELLLRFRGNDLKT